MSRNWTDSQRDAIEAKGGSVLVSAAAGSGKTAVLVERVIRRLTDRENPCDADRLLIVTFTRAAAQEMRQRIGDALDRLLRLDSANENLINQQLLLPSAKICTIDSFCLDLVRDNFERLPVDPDFKTADSGELELLAAEAMDRTMETMYQTDESGDFRRLVELLFSGRDDGNLAKMIDKLYTCAMSFPSPESWLDSLALPYEKEEAAGDSIFGQVIVNKVRSCGEYALSLSKTILSHCDADETVEKLFGDAVRSDQAQYENIIAQATRGDWDSLRGALNSFSAARRKNTPPDLKEDPVIKACTAMRDEGKKRIKNISALMCCSDEEYTGDMKFFRPAVRALIAGTKLYMKNFSEIKKQRKLADFNDISHMALSLLVEEKDGSFCRTALAESISLGYEEIFIDEYQDTNAAQDMLFTAISRDNLFRVGDVKQSIYRFRQANPDIFIGLKDAAVPFDRKSPAYPAKVILGNNFRSRKGVTDIINFVFSQLMSRECGDIDYGEEEKLVPSAAYGEKSGPDTELHLIDTVDADKYIFDSDAIQGEYIAKLIRQSVESGMTVSQGDGERPVRYGDFAVLLRSGNSKALSYADAFRQQGVPCYTEVPGKFLQSTEISLMLNMLRIIDNPKQDVPLTSVLMSPVFGFSVDDVSRLRLGDRSGDIYSCLLQSSEEKTLAFLETVRRWRALSVCLCVSELIRLIYEETALPSIFDAVDPSGIKRGNLLLLVDYAGVYENLGYSSLSGFIKFVDRLSSKQRDISGTAQAALGSDAVKIMTIHKSKGLEFPVCIIGSCASAFNRMDEKENLVINQKLGMGLIRRDIDTFEQYPTLCHDAVKLSLHDDNISEELRVLYVAMTRAKEKLIMVCAADNILKKCGQYGALIPEGREKFTPYAVCSASGYGEWLLSTLLRHPDAAEIREQAGVSEKAVLPCDSGLKVVYSQCAERSESSAAETDWGKVDTDFLSLIRERVEFRYPYEALSGVMTKRAASEVDKNSIDRDYFASSAPAFLSSGGLTGAARGIATHTFVQYADFAKAKRSVKEEIERLRSKGILTAAEADGINVPAVERFFAGELAERIMRSPKVMREKKFTVEVPIHEIYDIGGEAGEEKMMIQGIADCAFLEDGKLVVVDYKTDSLDREEDFVEKYRGQVLLYKKALSLCTGYEVTQTLLYSFHLGREICVTG
ncbi:MAG: helicase-exonuclease AddAB subunit AddA [Oscillospiraceae bacterium]|nr:helicase-exonuclease AddAB subunit AddA [Oscillospiraceae bacterium]